MRLATIVVLPEGTTEPPAGASRATIFVTQKWLSDSIDADDLLPFATYAITFPCLDKKPDLAAIDGVSSRRALAPPNLRLPSAGAVTVKRERTSERKSPTAASSFTTGQPGKMKADVPATLQATSTYSMEQDEDGNEVIVVLDSDSDSDDDGAQVDELLRRSKRRKTVRIKRDPTAPQKDYDVAECQRERVQEVIDVLKLWRRVRKADKRETVIYLRSKLKFAEWQPLWTANRPYIMQNVPGLGDGYSRARLPRRVTDGRSSRTH